MDSGFVLVDKPQGWTSHDVVAKVRRLTGIKKVGHAGTLDPMATGLLVLGVGRATRLLRFVQGQTKRYAARAVFGVATNTLDADGEVLSTEPMPVSRLDVAAAMERFDGPMMQVPPMVSARKVDGKRLYDLAREGKTIEREARPVEIYDLTLTDFVPSDYPEVAFEVACSTGTYVRTLADDIAVALGGRAHLIELRRLANGSLSVADAHEIEALEAAAAGESIAELMTTAADGLADLPSLVVGGEVERGIRHGVAAPLELLGPDAPVEGSFGILDGRGELLAVYRADRKQAVAEVVIA